MPHIVVEVTPDLGAKLDFVSLFSEIYRRISDDGAAVLNDFKSRVYITDRHLAGDDPAGEFVIARLVTSNPRPKHEQQAMAKVINDILRSAIEHQQPSYWWQCCVFIELFEKAEYLKTHSRA